MPDPVLVPHYSLTVRNKSTSTYESSREITRQRWSMLHGQVLLSVDSYLKNQQDLNAQITERLAFCSFLLSSSWFPSQLLNKEFKDTTRTTQTRIYCSQAKSGIVMGDFAYVQFLPESTDFRL